MRPRGQRQHFLDVPLLEPALGRKELEPVAVERQVARGDHHAAVELVALGDAGQEHGGRRREATAGNLPSRGGDAGGQGPLEHGTGEARVAADRYPRGKRSRGGLAAASAPSCPLLLPPEELDEPLADEEGHRRGQSQRLALDPRDGDAADVGAVLEALVDELDRGRGRRGCCCGRGAGAGRRGGGGGSSGGGSSGGGSGDGEAAAGGSCYLFVCFNFVPIDVQ